MFVLFFIGFTYDIATVKVQFTKKIAVSFVPTVGEDMKKLFDIMKFKLPNKISY
jgi:hypothetical protein